MPCLECRLHGLKADPSARANDQDCRHGVMLRVGSAWLTVMCGAGSHTARWAGLCGRTPPTRPQDGSDSTRARNWRTSLRRPRLAISIPLDGTADNTETAANSAEERRVGRLVGGLHF